MSNVKPHIPVTLVAIDTKRHSITASVVRDMLSRMTFDDIVICSNEKNPWFGIEHRFLKTGEKMFQSMEEYSSFCITRLYEAYFTTSHILTIHYDGFVLRPEKWVDKWLDYDYIGSKWTYPDHFNVGNGGFSLRSTKLVNILAEDPRSVYSHHHPEDSKIGRDWRPWLESDYGINFASEYVADQFGFEQHAPNQPTFGFHDIQQVDHYAY